MRRERRRPENHEVVVALAVGAPAKEQDRTTIERRGGLARAVKVGRAQHALVRPPEGGQLVGWRRRHSSAALRARGAGFEVRGGEARTEKLNALRLGFRYRSRFVLNPGLFCILCFDPGLITYST